MRRHGLTLIELLVVLAIIAILIALLLAGVQRARAAAARIACQNQLRQLTLAAHDYHNARGHLPPGVRLPGRPGDTSLGLYSSWLALLLPYVEQGPLHQQAEAAYKAHPWPFHNPTHPALGTVVPAFACPADHRARSPQFSHRHKLTVGLTSYLGVLGTDHKTLNGVLFANSRIRFADVTDGLSNTLAVGERPPSGNFAFGWWYAGTGQAESGSLDMVLGVREQNAFTDEPECGDVSYRYRAGRVDDPCSTFHFWSPHAGGANFAFADGSVRFLKYTADDIMPALATRAGGEVVPVPD